MVLLQTFYRVNTTLTSNNGYSAIQYEEQSHCISAAEGSLQLVGHNVGPQTDNHVISRNLGSSKGSNSYSWTRDKNNVKLGDGVSVVPASLRPSSLAGWKGKQFISFLKPVSGINYSTQSYNKRNLEVILRIECSYKQLFSMDIYKSAYQKLRSKPGNMTPGEGVDYDTLDGISKQWAESIISGMKNRDFKFKPCSMVLIPKPNGKIRPLGIPTPKDKIVQQAIRMLFESVYEPIFSNHSHGFRPNRSTTTAVFEVRK
jgi:hypothetical protein